MKRIILAAAALFIATPAFSQNPPNLPGGGYVWGRISPVAGPSQAVPIAQLGPLIGASSQTITGNWTFAPLNGDAITINPLAASYAKGFNITQTTPTSGSTTGPVSLNLITANYQGEIAFTGTVNGLNNTNSAGFRVNLTTGGTNPGSSGANGSQAINAGVFHLMDTVAGTQTSFPDRIALLSMCYVKVNHGDAHGCYGANLNAWVDSGGVIGQLIGVEPDMLITGTGSAAHRSAFSAINAGTGRATTLDAAIRVGSAVANGEWGNVIALIGTNVPGFLAAPVLNTANLVTDSGQAFTMGSILNMPNVTVSTNILSFPFVTLTGPGALTLNPSGVVSVPTLIANVTFERIVRNGPVVSQMSAAGSGGAGGAFIALSNARTSVSAPTAVQADDLFGGLTWFGYGATGYSASSRARIFASASETWSDTLQGAYMSFSTTPTGGTATAEGLRLFGSGGISVGNANISTDPGAGGILSTTYQSGNTAPSGNTVIQIGIGSATSRFIDIKNTAGEASFGVTAAGVATFFAITGAMNFGTATNTNIDFVVNNSLNALSIVSGAALVNTSVAVKSTLAATSATAASLTVAGGLGVTGTIYAAGIASASGNDLLCYTTASGLITYAVSVVGCVPSAMSMKIPLGQIDPQHAFKGILGLTPAIYRYKDEVTFGSAAHDGLYADEVCAIDERLCDRDADGKVRNYDKVGTMAYVIAAFQKLATKVETLERRR